MIFVLLFCRWAGALLAEGNPFFPRVPITGTRKQVDLSAATRRKSMKSAVIRGFQAGSNNSRYPKGSDPKIAIFCFYKKVMVLNRHFLYFNWLLPEGQKVSETSEAQGVELISRASFVPTA